MTNQHDGNAQQEEECLPCGFNGQFVANDGGKAIVQATHCSVSAERYRFQNIPGLCDFVLFIAMTVPCCDFLYDVVE